MKIFIKTIFLLVLLWLFFMGMHYLNYKLTGRILLDSFYIAGFIGFIVCLAVVISLKIRN